MDYVFHGSNMQGLNIINPSYSGLLHKKLVYASLSFYIASLFLDKVGGDYFCSIIVSKAHHQPVIVERVRDGLKHRFQSQFGSVYRLNKKDFESRETIWRGEVVSQLPVLPVEEIKITNIIQYIYALIDLGKIEYVQFEDRHKWVNLDDNDLEQLFKLEIKTERYNKELLNFIKTHHPSIYHTYALNNPLPF